MDKIGFIGVGFMGAGMAKNILQAGYPLQIKGNRNRAPIDRLVGLGAQEATSPAEMAATCDIIHICLSNSPQVEAMIRGKDGILQGAREGLIVIDCSTSNPTSTLALAEELAAKGAVLVDAPLGRTPKEAEAGTLDALVGASPEVFNRIKPVLDTWSGTATLIGPTGSGHKMKLLMNFLAMGYGALYSELLSLGAAVDLPPQTVRDVLAPSRLGNGFFDTFMQYAVDRDPEAHKFSITNAGKDITYVNQMATDAGVVNNMAGAIKHYYTHAQAVGGGADYLPMLSDHVARLNGIDLAAAVAKGKG